MNRHRMFQHLDAHQHPQRHQASRQDQDYVNASHQRYLQSRREETRHNGLTPSESAEMSQDLLTVLNELREVIDQLRIRYAMRISAAGQAQADVTESTTFANIWEEQEHPRAKDGKFATSGGGAGGGGTKAESTAHPEQERGVAQVLAKVLAKKVEPLSALKGELHAAAPSRTVTDAGGKKTEPKAEEKKTKGHD